MYQPRPTDRKFKAVLKQGHAGAGKHTEVVRFIWAASAAEAWQVAQQLGSIKAVISIREVTDNDENSGNRLPV